MTGALVMLELAGLVTQLPGQWFKRNTLKRTNEDTSGNGQTMAGEGVEDINSSTIAAAISFIRSTYHGVSRKYLQLYLAAFWYHTDKKYWHEGALLEACQYFLCVNTRMQLDATLKLLSANTMVC